EAVDLDDLDARASVATHEGDQAPDRSAPEDEHRIARLDLGARHVVSGDSQWLDDGGVVVAERIGNLEQPLGRDRPVVLHAAGKLAATHLQAIAEIRGAHPARSARPAELDRLDDHAITLPEAAPRGRLRHFREGLVADDATPWNAVVEMSLVDVQ